MKLKIFALFAVAMVAVAGVDVYKVSVSDVEMSVHQKENVEVLTEGESGLGKPWSLNWWETCKTGRKAPKLVVR